MVSGTANRIFEMVWKLPNIAQKSQKSQNTIKDSLLNPCFIKSSQSYLSKQTNVNQISRPMRKGELFVKVDWPVFNKNFIKIKTKELYVYQTKQGSLGKLTCL